jgi:hypothetical protein
VSKSSNNEKIVCGKLELKSSNFGNFEDVVNRNFF